MDKYEGRFAAPQQALEERSAPNDLAASVYVFNGRAVVMRIVDADSSFALLFDDGGLTVRRTLFKDVGEFELILPRTAGDLEVGYEEAREELIQRFIFAQSVRLTNSSKPHDNGA